MTATEEKPAGAVEEFPALEPKAVKIGVMIATPLRTWRGEQDLPPAIGAALKELATRGTPRWEGILHAQGNKADRAFREQADQYVFEFAAAVGGLCRARNGCVDEFLRRSNHSFLLWNDSDLTLPDGMTLADAWLRLLSHRQPVVGALYTKRAKRPAWVATWMPAAEYQPDADGLLQVAELGGGMKCFHRKVYTELGRIFGSPDKDRKGSIGYRDRDTGEWTFGFYQNFVHEGDLLSEDYFLDYLCRCAKVPILADTKIKVRHGEGGKVYPEGAFPPIPAIDAV